MSVSRKRSLGSPDAGPRPTKRANSTIGLPMTVKASEGAQIGVLTGVDIMNFEQHEWEIARLKRLNRFLAGFAVVGPIIVALAARGLS